jgi:hypothetical protein
MTVFWISFLATTATAALIIRLFFIYSEYVRLNVSRLSLRDEEVPAQEVSASKEDAKSDAKKKPAKKAAKKKPAKKSKKKKN